MPARMRIMDSASLQLRKCCPILAQMLIVFLVQDEPTYRQSVHPRSQEAVDRLGRRLDDGLILIKGRVEQHRHACYFLKLVNQLPIQRMYVALHWREPPGPVPVRHRRNLIALLWLDFVCHYHEWRRVVCLEVLAHPLRKNRRTERPERLPVSDG